MLDPILETQYETPEERRVRWITMGAIVVLLAVAVAASAMQESGR